MRTCAKLCLLQRSVAATYTVLQLFGKIGPLCSHGMATAGNLRKKEKHRCFSYMDSGNVLLSRAVSSQVPSALKGLTSVFGMGTGGTPSPSSPETVNFFSKQLAPFATALCYHILPFLSTHFCVPTGRSFRRSSHPDNCTAFRFELLSLFSN